MMFAAAAKTSCCCFVALLVACDVLWQLLRKDIQARAWVISVAAGRVLLFIACLILLFKHCPAL
jgi:hypothetical protein